MQNHRRDKSGFNFMNLDYISPFADEPSDFKLEVLEEFIPVTPSCNVKRANTLTIQTQNEDFLDDIEPILSSLSLKKGQQFEQVMRTPQNQPGIMGQKLSTQICLGISNKIVVDIMKQFKIGQQSFNQIKNFNYDQMMIIDCRWPYEYNAGSVISSVNINRAKDLNVIIEQKPLQKMVIIFYCEFSKVRARKMSNYFVNMDRKLHKICYYDQVFVMEGGYSTFVEKNPLFSTTGKYICEKDVRFEQQQQIWSQKSMYLMGLDPEEQYLLEQ